MRTVVVAGVPGAWSTSQLAIALEMHGFAVDVVDLGECSVDAGSGEVHAGATCLTSADAVVVKKLGTSEGVSVAARLAALEAVERKGVHIFSRPAAIARAVDRVRMTFELAAAGIPIPDTCVTESLDEAERAVERFRTCVVKPVFTSKGRGMILIRSSGALRLKLRRFGEENGGVYYIQRFVDSGGKDIAVAILGGRVVGAYARVAGKSWLTTTNAGGRYARQPITWALADLATRAARPFGLDFTVVDIAVAERGPVVYELSAFGGFRGLLETRGIDAASMYADHVAETLSREGSSARSA